MKKRVKVSSDLVELMAVAADLLESGEEDDEALLEADDGIQTEHGFGGRRADGRYAFTFYPHDQGEKWEFVLLESEVLSLADAEADVITVEASPHKKGDKRPEKKTVDPGHGTGVGAIEALVSSGLLALTPRASLFDVGQAFEDAAGKILDEPKLSESEQREAIMEFLMEHALIDEVFGEDEEVFAVVRKVLG